MGMSTAELAEVIAQVGGSPLPVGTGNWPAWAQTFDRRLATGAVLTPTTQLAYYTAIWLPGGALVTGISFVTVGAETTGAHWFNAIHRGDTLALLGQSTDNTSTTAILANAVLRGALATAVTLPYSGLYYLSFCANFSSAPTLVCANTGSINLNGNITGMTPVLSAVSVGTYTTTAPNPAVLSTPNVTLLYGFVD